MYLPNKIALFQLINVHKFSFVLFKIFIWLCQVLVEARGIFHCCAQASLAAAHGLMWDLISPTRDLNLHPPH